MNFSRAKSALLAAALAGSISLPMVPAMAQEDTIKVGILHSLSGTMAISETTLKDTMLFLIEQQNAKGGVLGKQLEPVVVDIASDWPLAAELARQLIEVDDVDGVGADRNNLVLTDRNRAARELYECSDVRAEEVLAISQTDNEGRVAASADNDTGLILVNGEKRKGTFETSNNSLDCVWLCLIDTRIEHLFKIDKRTIKSNFANTAVFKRL